MKLDEEVIDKILAIITCDCETYDDAVDALKELNLVFKPGDSSHSTLVDLKDVL